MNIYIETYGCSANQAESEMMAGLLARSGFHIVTVPEAADVLVVNTCVVKKPTEDKILERLRQLRKKYPKKNLVITGCMPEVGQEKIRDIAPNASLISTHHVADIGKAMPKIMNGEVVELTGKSKKEKLCIPRIRRNECITIVPISSGCLSRCSYCIVKNVKGELFSYSKEKIIQEISSSRKAGCKEFWLTGQDCGCYGFDSADQSGGLPELLNSITSSIPGKYWLRVGMMNPGHVKKIQASLIDAYKDEHIFNFLHLPVQSGSDDVLEKMNRGYTVTDFEKIMSSFKEAMPQLQFWTDTIVGFPGESDSDFIATCELIKETKPDFVNVSKFGMRPGTPAEKMGQVDAQIVKERSKILSALVDEIAVEKNQQWLGWSGPVIIDEYNHEKKSWIGRNFAYKPIVINSAKLHLGDIVSVEITGAGRILLGSILQP